MNNSVHSLLGSVMYGFGETGSGIYIYQFDFNLIHPDRMPGEINENIKSIRELKNYTQEYMAFRLGITQAGYSKMERNGSRISFEKLEEIAVIFEMDLKSIINFGSTLSFKSNLQNPLSALTGSGLLNAEYLYRDKIRLLEKLLDMTDRELKTYKDKFGCL